MQKKGIVREILSKSPYFENTHKSSNFDHTFFRVMNFFSLYLRFLKYCVPSGSALTNSNPASIKASFSACVVTALAV
jgi:hypothetical protein